MKKLSKAPSIIANIAKLNVICALSLDVLPCYLCILEPF